MNTFPTLSTLDHFIHCLQTIKSHKHVTLYMLIYIYSISLCYHRGLRYEKKNQLIRNIFPSFPYGWYWAESMIDHSFCFYFKSKGIVISLQALKSILDTMQALTPSRWSLLILPLLGLTEKLAYFSL